MTSDELGLDDQGHTYLSTACWHERHDYCASMVGYQGEKRPAQCKFCSAHCICACHNGIVPLAGGPRD